MLFYLGYGEVVWCREGGVRPRFPGVLLLCIDVLICCFYRMATPKVLNFDVRETA